MLKSLFTIIFVFILCGLSACDNPHSSAVTQEDSGLNFSDEKSAPMSPAPDNTDENNKNKPEPSLNPKNVYNLTDSIESGGFTFSNLNTKIASKLPQKIKTADFIYFDDEVDDKSILKGEYEYIFATVNIKNNSEKPQGIYLSGCSYIIVDENLRPLEGLEDSRELRYISNHKPKANSKNFYHETFEAGEVKNITLGYLVNKVNLKKGKLHFAINIGGRVALDDDLFLYEQTFQIGR